MHDGGTWRLGHRPGLDGLRGVAVLLVVIGHSIPVPYSLAGAVGVSVFFALSGFLITTLLLERGDGVRLGGFYLRRARRLLPAAVVFLACMVGLGVLIGPWLTTPAGVVPPLFYVQNFAVVNGQSAPAFVHLWSLSVEEQFYFLWPLLLAGAVTLGRRAAVVLVALGIVASLGVRAWLLASGADLYRIYFASDTNACLLLAGCATALAVRRWRPRVPAVVFWAAIAATAALGFLPNTRTTLAVVPVAAVLLALAAILPAISVRAPRTAPWLELVGRRSYALYLWHFPLVEVIPNHLSVSHWVSVPIGAAAAWGMTLLSWRFVEEPFMRQRSGRLDLHHSRPSDPARVGVRGT